MSFSHTPKKPLHSRSTSTPTLFQSLTRHVRNISTSSTASVFSTQSVSTTYTTPASSRGGSRPTSEQYAPGTFTPPSTAIKPPIPTPGRDVAATDLPERPEAISPPMNELQQQEASLRLSSQNGTPSSPAEASPAPPAPGANERSTTTDDASTQPQPHPSTNPFRSAPAPAPKHQRPPSNPLLGAPEAPPAAAPPAPLVDLRAATAVYVLTLATSAGLSAHLDAVRAGAIASHGDAAAAAHVTLFRALPAARLGDVDARLLDVAARLGPLRVRTGAVRRREGGVVVLLEGGGERRVAAMREALAREWAGALGEGDGAPFVPGWVVVEGVGNAYVVEKTVQELERWEGAKGFVHGLVLWRVAEDGAWSFHKSYEFLGTERWPLEENKESG